MRRARTWAPAFQLCPPGSWLISSGACQVVFSAVRGRASVRPGQAPGPGNLDCPPPQRRFGRRSG
eukprot:2977929-Lingulodinium_polyedra.AAC.1